MSTILAYLGIWVQKIEHPTNRSLNNKHLFFLARSIYLQSSYYGKRKTVRIHVLDFPGGPSGLRITCPRDSSIWSGKIPNAAEQLSHAPQLLSLHSRACKERSAAIGSPCLATKCNSLAATRESPCITRPSTAEKKKEYKSFRLCGLLKRLPFTLVCCLMGTKWLLQPQVCRSGLFFHGRMGHG